MKSAVKREKDPRWQNLVAFLMDVRAISFDSYIDYWANAYSYDEERCPDIAAYMRGTFGVSASGKTLN